MNWGDQRDCNKYHDSIFSISVSRKCKNSDDKAIIHISIYLHVTKKKGEKRTPVTNIPLPCHHIRR
jgi:hypothetical protein